MKQLKRARVELEYDGVNLTCLHHSSDLEPTLIIVGEDEYLGFLSVDMEDDTYIVRFKILK